MGVERVLHFRGARFENVEQVPVAAFEVFKHLAQLLRGGFGIEPKHPVDDVIGPGLIGGIEISRFDCGFEGTDYHARRVGAQV